MHNLAYIETSAKANINVDKALGVILEQIYNDVEEREPINVLLLHEPTKETNKCTTM